MSTPGPFAQHLGFDVVEATPQGAVVVATPTAESLNGGGIVHGGWLSSLLDSATGWAVHAALGEGAVAPHVAINVQFLRAAVAGEPVTCRARATHAGRRTAAAEGEAEQGGRIVARATTTHAVLRP